MSRLSTGVPALDRSLDGGVHSGSIVVLTAPPASGSNLLIKSLLNEHPTVYLTTLLRASISRQRLEDLGSTGSEVAVRSLTEDYSLDDFRAVLADIPDRTNVVIDTTTPLERSLSPEAYREFLNDLIERVKQIDSLGVLHCMEFGEERPAREYTLSAADAVWQFRRTVESTGLEVSLVVRKFRHSSAIGEVVKLQLGEDIDIDTSRDIA